MNTESQKRIKSLRESPEVVEAMNIIYTDVNHRLHNAINAHRDQQEDDTHVKSFLEGKRDAYWNIQDLLAKIMV